VALLTHRGRRGTRAAILLSSALLLAGGTALRAQNFNEYEVKSAMIYKFASFVDWPAGTGSGPFCIGILGRDPFGRRLDQAIRGKSIHGRRFVVRRFSFGQDTGTCQIVFVGLTERKTQREALERLRREPVLTVGDTPGFCENGGMINLVLANHQIHFQINTDAAAQARLAVSSSLLSLASIVHGGAQ
jgi:hypothetical protein